MDGGGVRGYLELCILEAVQQILGGKIPIQRFFDLIAGTGTGALVAIGLGLKGWLVADCVGEYKSFCKDAFTPHSKYSW